MKSLFDYEHLDNDYFYNFINIKSNNLMKNYKIDIDNNSLVIKSGNNVIKYIFLVIQMDMLQMQKSITMGW